MLNEPTSQDSGGGRPTSGSGSVGSDPEDAANLAAALGATTLQVTQQDKEAIERVG